MKTCKICGTEFIPTGTRQLYCSDICVKVKKNNGRRKDPVLFHCQICEKEFIQKRKDNVTCSAACSQLLWVKNNPEKNWHRHNSKERREWQKEWIKNNYDNYREIQNKSKRKRYRENLKYRLNRLMGNAIRNTIKDKNGMRWEKIVNYDINTLIEHLINTLPENVTWNDYLNGGYHIDHIIPQDAYVFDSYKDPEFLKCWHYRNLRVVTDNENLTKLASIDYELIKNHKIEDLLPNNFVM